MFFFIAGIQPKTKLLNKTPRICPSCGQLRAYSKRVDHYVSLFFIPLFPVKRGEPTLICDLCNNIEKEDQGPYTFRTRDNKYRCTGCGRALKKEFVYCPYCGRRV